MAKSNITNTYHKHNILMLMHSHASRKPKKVFLVGLSNTILRMSWGAFKCIFMISSNKNEIIKTILPILLHKSRKNECN